MKELEQRGYSHIVHFAAGGEGNVYTCEKDGVTYIAKIISTPGPEQIDILKSINALRNVYFPKIVEIIHNENSTIIIREYVEGTTLAEEIKKNGCFSYSRAKKIIFDVCNALRLLHAMKPHPVVYRDLKPDNIIIMPDGNIKLIDFGIARYYKRDSVHDTVLAGTRGYTAPEVMAGIQSDERSDIYSVGLLLYELLSGKSLQDPPYQIRPVAEHSEYLPDYIDEIIAKATDINQTNRYATLEEFVFELDSIKEIKAARMRKKRKRRMLIAAAMIAVIAVAAILLEPLFFGEKAETLLHLEFDDEDDLGYVMGHEQNLGTMFTYHDGYVSPNRSGGLMFNYALRGGMLAHFRVQFGVSAEGCVALSSVGDNTNDSYRISREARFEAVFEKMQDGQLQESIGTQDNALQGLPIANNGQYVDVILYISEDGNAVYAFVCDGDAIAYTAYQIPKDLKRDKYYAESVAFFGQDDDYINLDAITIAEGSVTQYLAENTTAYKKHKQRIDGLFSIETANLPEMELQLLG